MARPKAYPALLYQTCRKCRRDLAIQFFRRNSRTCIPCMDGTEPPSDEENVPKVPATHRIRRRSWPEDVQFTGPKETPKEERPTTCQFCGAALASGSGGGGETGETRGRYRRYCGVKCRVGAFKTKSVYKALAGRKKRR